MTGQPADRENLDLIDSLNKRNLKSSLRVIFSDMKRTVRILAARPSLVLAGARIHLHQKRAEGLRLKARAEGLNVPVMMLVSITSRCNLSCSGCYMRHRGAPCVAEMTAEELRSVITQAEELGISAIAFIGGEPLLRSREVISLARAFPRILFTLSTNGILIDERIVAELAGCGNLVPLVSLEGFEAETDRRRGKGTYNRLLSVFSLLNQHVLFFGCAVTVTRNNLMEVLGEPFISAMIGAGARAFIYIQYVPASPGTEDLVPLPDEQLLIRTRIQEFNRDFPASFMAVPGEMELFGGCLAAGRGFIHVSPCGDLEPCPIVPVSDVNLRTTPLKEALQSHLLSAIRRNHRSLHANGRCILRTNSRWLEQIRSAE